MSDLLIGIRHARSADATGIAAVYQAAWREAYQGIIPGLILERMLARRGARWWRASITRARPLAVLEVGEVIAGYASYGRCRDQAFPADGEIDELYLAPEYQGLGFGSRLFRAVRNDLADRGARRVLVWALADNERARGFYEALGGQAVAEAVEPIGGASLRKVGYRFT